MECNNRLVEMIDKENGYMLNHLSPFFLHNHIYEMLDKVNEGLHIYIELQKIASSEDIESLIEIIRNARGEDVAVTEITDKFKISECSAQHILNMPIEELCRIDGVDYASAIKMYKEAASSFRKMAEMQSSIDSIN